MKTILITKLTSRKFWFVALGIASSTASAMADVISPDKAFSISTLLTLAYLAVEGARDVVLAWKGGVVKGGKAKAEGN